MDKNEPEKGGSPANSYARYSSMGFQMIAIIGAFTYGGYLIDKSAHHSVQWVTATLALCGVFISLYLVIRSVKS